MPSPHIDVDLDLGLLEPNEACRFEHMTFPAYRGFLSSLGAPEEPPEPGVVAARPLAVRALACGEPAGLVLAEVRPGDPDAPSDLLSLYVAEDRRGQGIATRLLERVEDVARERGCSVLHAVYMTGKPSTEALESVLAKRGWPRPERRAVTIRFTPEEATRTPWWDRGRLASGDEVFPWREARPEEIDTLRRSQSLTGWIPSGLEPWRYDATALHEPSSIGLRRRGRIVGWAITHPIAADSVRITCAYIERPLAARGLTFRLFRESIRRLGESGVRWCTFISYVEHPSMVRFVEERCAPWVSYFGELRGSSRVLHTGGGSVTVRRW